MRYGGIIGPNSRLRAFEVYGCRRSRIKKDYMMFFWWGINTGYLSLIRTSRALDIKHDAPVTVVRRNPPPMTWQELSEAAGRDGAHFAHVSTESQVLDFWGEQPSSETSPAVQSDARPRSQIPNASFPLLCEKQQTAHGASTKSIRTVTPKALGCLKSTQFTIF